MRKKYIVFIFFFFSLVIGFTKCKNNISKHKIIGLKEVELEIQNEVEMLRKQIFFNFLYRHQSFRKVLKEDGATYSGRCKICLSFYFDPNLKSISDKWFLKVYSNEMSDKNYYIMKSLDFMMSEDLNNYLDSVKAEITKDPQAWFIGI